MVQSYLTLRFQYIECHSNVIAVTGSQEVYPNKMWTDPGPTTPIDPEDPESEKITDPVYRTIDGVDIGEDLHGLRPRGFESIYRGQAMQGFE